MQNPVIIFGANSLGRIVKEIFEQNKVIVYGFLDDDKKLHDTEVDDVVVLEVLMMNRLLNLLVKSVNPLWLQMITV